MSSSICCISYQRLSAVYLFKKNLTQIYFTVMSYNIYFYSLWQQTTSNILEENILNYLPNVMFFGTPCIYEKNISELQTVDYNQKDTELIDS